MNVRFATVAAVRLICSLLTTAALVCAAVGTADAASNISATARYGWSENAGWTNFLGSSGSVTVYYHHLAGYAWQENIGWIKLGADLSGPYQNSSATNWGVNLDVSGNLSGYAWSEGWGWINFRPTGGGVSFNPANGIFDGYAWGENFGWLHLKSPTALYNVATIPYTLQITFNPAETGSGMVICASPSFSSNTNYSKQFYYVIPLSLATSPSQYCLLSSWSGCDSTPGTNCQLTMGQDRTATATFNLDMPHSTRINGIYYNSLANAYANANPANGTTIQAWGISFPENGLVCSGTSNVTLIGGYDEPYLNTTGMTAIKGKLTVSGTGSVRVEHIAVK